MNVRGQKIVVIGAGKSGLAAAALLCRKGAEVVLNDRREREVLGDKAREIEAVGASLALGSHELGHFEGASLVVVSPGVPPLPVFDALAERGVEIIAEVELAARCMQGDLLCVTGTNGKSTVTTLIGAMVAASGRPTFCGGNLGVALCDAVETPAGREGGAIVAELSSFQLERVRTLRPRVSVLLNVSPDHLDRYSNYEAYAQAKGNLFLGQQADDFAVIPSGDPQCSSLAAAGSAEIHHFGRAQGEVCVEDGQIVHADSGFAFDLSAYPLVGRHNESNACAAVLAAHLFGVNHPSIAQGLRGVEPLPHRTARVRELDGVLYVDDSKATNVGATLAAIDGLASVDRRVVLIAGGVDKGGSYAPLAARLSEVGRGVVLIGEATPIMRDALSALALPVQESSSLETAVSVARSLANPGDIVLLAPACSSFDMFRSYAHRGDVFVAAVQALKEAN